MNKNNDLDFKLDLDAKELEWILSLAKQIISSPSLDPDQFCKEVKEISNRIPDWIRAKLLRFKEKGSPTGYFLINTFLFLEDDFITPSDNKQRIGETTLLAKVQALLLSVLGEMLAYEAEGCGHLFQDVVPHRSMATNQTSLGSQVELEIHTEQAFSKLRPDFLSLACLRGDTSAFTYLLPVQVLLEHLTSEERIRLFQPLWYTGVDLSFKLYGKEFLEGDVRGPMAILHKLEDKEDDLHFVFDQDLMKGTDKASRLLIQKIIDIYYEKRLSHCLQPGQILFIDNRRAVHGRSPFFPKYNGKDRFLIRSFATLDYEKSAYARPNGGRMIGSVHS